MFFYYHGLIIDRSRISGIYWRGYKRDLIDFFNEVVHNFVILLDNNKLNTDKEIVITVLN